MLGIKLGIIKNTILIIIPSERITPDTLSRLSFGRIAKNDNLLNNPARNNFWQESSLSELLKEYSLAMNGESGENFSIPTVGVILKKITFNNFHRGLLRRMFLIVEMLDVSGGYKTKIIKINLPITPGFPSG